MKSLILILILLLSLLTVTGCTEKDNCDEVDTFVWGCIIGCTDYDLRTKDDTYTIFGNETILQQCNEFCLSTKEQCNPPSDTIR